MRTDQYCLKCGESPESASHLFDHDYVGGGEMKFGEDSLDIVRCRKKIIKTLEDTSLYSKSYYARACYVAAISMYEKPKKKQLLLQREHCFMGADYLEALGDYISKFTGAVNEKESCRGRGRNEDRRDYHRRKVMTLDEHIKKFLDLCTVYYNKSIWDSDKPAQQAVDVFWMKIDRLQRERDEARRLAEEWRGRFVDFVTDNNTWCDAEPLPWEG